MSENIKYLYDNKEISNILAQGFAKICQQKPKFPINYLARYLKNHTTKNNQKTQLIDRIQSNIKTEQSLASKQLSIKQQLQQKLKQVNNLENQKQTFLTKLTTTQRHQQILNEFCQWTCNNLSLASVYIGQLQNQLRQVNLIEEDGEEAHLQLEKEKIVKFKYASQGQKEVVIGKVLELESVVGKLVTATGEEVTGEEETGQNQQQGGKTQQPKGEIYFNSVVGNQQLKFFRYPKLGAWFACSLTIKSYLKQKLFDQNTIKVQNYKKVLHQFQKEMQEKQTKFKQMYDQKANSGVEERELEEMEREFQKQKNDIPKPVREQFSFYQRKFVVCADTLGKDREITLEQKELFRGFIAHLKQSWQQQQKKQLEQDIDHQLSLLAPSHDQGHDTQVPNYQQQLTTLIQQEEKEIPSHQQVQKVKDNEKLFQLQSNTVRVEKTREYMNEEKFLRHWEHLLKLNVVKYPQVIKQFLVLLGYKKEEFCFAGTNVLDWLRTREMLKTQAGKVQQRLNMINPRGSKPQIVPAYAKCHRIVKNLEGLQPLAIAGYNIYMALILRLLQLYTKTRVQDREARVNKIQTQKELREQKIKQSEDKANQKREKLQALKLQLEEKGELQTFDEETWGAQWDEENPMVQIPEEVRDDVDRDLEDIGEINGEKGE